MNWQKFEQLIFDDACKALLEIKPKLANETALVFCLDCDSDSGTMIASINTEEGLARLVTQYQQRGGAYANRPEAELKAGLAENPGDFSHFDLAPGRFFIDGEYDDHIERINNPNNPNNFADDDARLDALRAEMELFMESVARVIVRLQQEDRFAILNRSADFVPVCVDHGESVTEGLARIERVRSSDENLTRPNAAPS